MGSAARIFAARLVFAEKTHRDRMKLPAAFSVGTLLSGVEENGYG